MVDKAALLTYSEGMDEYMSTEEAARRLGVTPAHVRRLAREGFLEEVHFSERAVVVRRSSVENYLLTRRPRGRPRAL